MNNKIVFTKINDIKEATKIRDMGVNVINDNINTKNKYKIIYSKGEILQQRSSHIKIINITNEYELDCYKDYMDNDEYLYLIDCGNLYENLYLHTKKIKRNKSIIKCNNITPHIAYMIFSIGCSGILCDSNDIFKNGGGKFINKINLAYKKAKNDRFYFKFFNTKKPFTQIRNINIDRIFKDLKADSIALDVSNPHLKTFIYVLKNQNIIKIGIVNNKNQFKIARNLQENALLDVLELHYNENLEYANFAFYSQLDSNFDMKIVD